jgi:hypothetical protein
MGRGRHHRRGSARRSGPGPSRRTCRRWPGSKTKARSLTRSPAARCSTASATPSDRVGTNCPGPAPWKASPDGQADQSPKTALPSSSCGMTTAPRSSSGPRAAVGGQVHASRSLLHASASPPSARRSSGPPRIPAERRPSGRVSLPSSQYVRLVSAPSRDRCNRTVAAAPRWMPSVRVGYVWI